VLNMSWTWAQSHTPKMRTDNRPLPEIYAQLRERLKPGEIVTFQQIKHGLDCKMRGAKDIVLALINKRMLERVQGDVFKMLEDPKNLPVLEAFRGRCVAQRKSPVDVFKSRSGVDWMQGRVALSENQESALAKWARS
jgi:hypothetical protein